MQAMIDKILHHIDKADSLILSDSQDKVFELKTENFHEIKGSNFFGKARFIDGGNMEVLRSPSISLFFNRVYSTTYSGNKRESSKLFESYVMTTAVQDGKNLFFSAEVIPHKGELDIGNYSFDSQDKTISFQGRRGEISMIGGVMRRFSELKAASGSTEQMIVLDGSLETRYTYEDKLIDELIKKKSMVCAVSKTTSLLTEMGNSATLALSKLSTVGSWYYPVGTEGNYDMYFAKLHPLSKYIFRIDVLRNMDYDISEMMGMLKNNSTDPIFLGYPYALVEADRFARVSGKEKEMLTMMLQSRMGKNFEKIRPLINSLNAHDILDSIS